MAITCSFITFKSALLKVVSLHVWYTYYIWGGGDSYKIYINLPTVGLRARVLVGYSGWNRLHHLLNLDKDNLC